MTDKEEGPGERPIGQVTHYFGKVGVMAVQLSDTLSVGDQIHVVGHSTDFVTSVQSMQIEHESVSQAGAGDSVGIKIEERARPGDMVYRAQ